LLNIRTMKRFTLIFIFQLSICLAFAQKTTERAVFTTGGVSSQLGNQVTLYAYNPNLDSLEVIDTMLGDFSNAVVTRNQYAYCHVGRMQGHPQGEDVVYQYDLLTKERVDSITNLTGLNSLTIKDNLIITTHNGEEAGEKKFRIFELDDLSTVYYDANIQNEDVFGCAVINDFVFTSYTKDNIGHLGVLTVDQFGVVFEDLVELDTISSGVYALFADDGLIYMVSNKFNDDFELEYSGLTKFDYIDYTFDTYEGEGIFSPIGIVNDNFVAIFNNEFNYLDLETMADAQGPNLPFYSSGVFDDLNQLLYLQETDNFSFGEMMVYDTAGVELGTYQTDIAGAAIELAINNAPMARDTGIGIANYFEGYQLDFSGFDVDADALTFEVFNQPMFVEFTPYENGVEVTSWLDIFSSAEAIITDVWGATDSFEFWIYASINTTEPGYLLPVNLSPNPANEQITIDASPFGNQELTIEVFNLSGQQVLQRKAQGGSSISLTINDLANGIYIVKMTDGMRLGIARFVKY